MKNLKMKIGILAASLLVLAGCRPEVTGELGDGWDKVKGISGTWEISGFYQKDLNSPVLEEREFTSMYVQDGTQPLQLSFNQSPRTYSAEIIVGKNFFGEGGTWSFDDDLYPSFLYLEGAEDTLSFDLGRMVREIDNQMELEIQGGCRDEDGIVTTETVVYRFVFDRK